MSLSPRLGLPMLAAGQAQKEVTHNEALQLLDALVAACVEDGGASSPPPNPAIGTCYIVTAPGSGAWEGRAGSLACYTSGGWRFVASKEGMRAMIRSSGITATYRAGAWDFGTAICTRVSVGGQQVVGARTGAIATPTGGTTIDSECRSAVSLIITALRHHGLINA